MDDRGLTTDDGRQRMDSGRQKIEIGEWTTDDCKAAKALRLLQRYFRLPAPGHLFWH
jgi:hypothetical protein